MFIYNTQMKAQCKRILGFSTGKYAIFFVYFNHTKRYITAIAISIAVFIKTGFAFSGELL